MERAKVGWSQKEKANEDPRLTDQGEEVLRNLSEEVRKLKEVLFILQVPRKKITAQKRFLNNNKPNGVWEVKTFSPTVIKS